MVDKSVTDIPAAGGTFFIEGPAGRIEVRADIAEDAGKGFAVVCHPHPLHGGTMQNKVVHTLARTYRQHGISAVRFNFRGVGGSEGQYAAGAGEQLDLQAVIDCCRARWPLPAQCYVAGFSFGAYVALRAAQQVDLKQLLLVAPPVHLFDFDSLPGPSASTLLIQGEDDEIVDSHQVRQWASGRHDLHAEWLPACGHFFHGKLNVLSALVSEHLAV